MANNHVNKKKQEEKDEELIRSVLKKGFEAGAAMAYWSAGKFEKEEDDDKLKTAIETLYREFEAITFHSKDSKSKESSTEEKDEQ